MKHFQKFPHYLQFDAMDCGPTCLRMIAKYYGKSFSIETLRARSFITREGVSMLGISDAAESIGFRTSGVRISMKQLVEDVPLPCILHWNQNHFVVCYDIRKKKDGYRFYIADPASQLVTYRQKEFEKCWFSTKEGGEDKGTALALLPTPQFETQEEEKTETGRSLLFFARYLSPYKQQIIQLILGMVVVSLLQLIFPFLTQSLVDVGIRDGNLNFITLILIAQLVVSLSQLSVGFIRSWIVLHMNTRINISLISDFLIKLMRLPLRFFDTKMIGDIMQRIGDHNRIEAFLTGSSIGTLFSFVNFFIFGAILAYYHWTILVIFIIGNAFYVAWVLFFMKYRRELDIKRFAQAAGEQSSLIQLISSMQEIKLNNSEKQKRWQWERIQVKLFKISVKGLMLGQTQQVGSIFFNQTTNILISFLAAKSVVNGEMTLGMMMSMTYIIGQLNGPIGAFIGFAQQLQDAKISLERLNEIHGKEDEEQDITTKRTTLPERKDIHIEHLCFSYDDKGTIKLGDVPIENINPHLWRAKSGAVMQDGYIFSDTIANNIAVGDDEPDIEKLVHAVNVANIRDFIDSLPLGYNTKIGMEGIGVSQGQKQRLLIARAVYKNPEFLFFDEATNALDANNEKEIMEHLDEFYKGKTVVVVAHRLSTVRNADKIVVIDQGKIAEEGTHQELVDREGLYFRLVQNQLELGK